MSYWRCLDTSPDELRLDTTLKCGQAFRWRLSGPDEWSCAFKGKLISIRQTETSVEYRSYPTTTTDIGLFLREYFQLHINLSDCYKRWSKADKHFAKIAGGFRGIRILKQDPVENLFCFICSQNNNIKRIEQMVREDRKGWVSWMELDEIIKNLCDHLTSTSTYQSNIALYFFRSPLNVLFAKTSTLCERYGKPIHTHNSHTYYDFPLLSSLSHASLESELRDLGFGYRAKYIAETAKLLEKRGEDWLTGLRTCGYEEAKELLTQLSGVGPKVADCVLLMSLDKPNAIPIDTHVWQIAKRSYGFSSSASSKTLTPRMYTEIAEYFRRLFGEYSGWAHSVLFTADLKAFENRQDVDKALNGMTKSKKKKRKADSQKIDKDIEKISRDFENLEKTSANANSGSSEIIDASDSINADKALRRSRRLRVQ
ncbi:7057_t:CDS:2 [Paraglomus brasilianum]|uniref:DNA-(apurinic or apyrimidinic site) lyase n=1 Tax=Paraglomus brasilianum TaxID=144538 RepID=A0A9N8YS08_9GLOM|nr:7057_t:CDS:2 [Paraglomus brasilianum]